MRRFLGLVTMAAGIAGCGPWIIEPPTPEPAGPTATVSSDDPARAVIAERFGIDPAALIRTEDGFAFVVRMGDEIQLLLSRDAAGVAVEVLARVEAAPFEQGSSGISSFAVVCPPGSVVVRHYLFGQDTRDIPRDLIGLDALGGDVIDGLWLLAITDDEIAPEQRWEVVDPLGTVGFQSGSGELFAADGETIGLGDSTLCEVN